MPPPAARTAMGVAAVAARPATPPAPVAPPSGPSPSLSAVLATSPVFVALTLTAERRAQALAAVEALSTSHGQCSIPSFAAAMSNVLPARVPSLVAVLGEALNLDGYLVIFVDRASQTVRLDVALLRALYQPG